MPRKKAATAEDVKKLLSAGRNRYDNEVLKLEKIWALLRPTDYKKRATIMNVATEMIKIEENIKTWENKLN